MLVFNVYAMEKGIDQLTDEEKFRLKQLERGEITEEALSDMSDTHQFITQKLVVFKDIASLQGDVLVASEAVWDDDAGEWVVIPIETHLD